MMELALFETTLNPECTKISYIHTRIYIYICIFTYIYIDMYMIHIHIHIVMDSEILNLNNLIHQEYNVTLSDDYTFN